VCRWLISQFELILSGGAVKFTAPPCLQIIKAYCSSE
jgi:hypothetical protein